MADNRILDSAESTKDYQTLSPSKSIPPPEDNNDMKTTNQSQPAENPKKKKIPRRIIHCSDGIYEEYSTDEEGDELEDKSEHRQEIVDPKSLTWVPWMVYYSWLAGSTFFQYCDSWGEKLAWFFGITSPKYYYELEEFKKMQLEEEERKQKEAENTAGWLEQGSQGGQVMDQPQQLKVSDLKPTELKYYQVQNENPHCDSQITTELDAESPR